MERENVEREKKRETSTTLAAWSRLRMMSKFLELVSSCEENFYEFSDENLEEIKGKLWWLTSLVVHRSHLHVTVTTIDEFLLAAFCLLHIWHRFTSLDWLIGSLFACRVHLFPSSSFARCFFFINSSVMLWTLHHNRFAQYSQLAVDDASETPNFN